MNTTIAEKLHTKLQEQFEEPFYDWVDTIDKNHAVFNYPNYFDTLEYAEDIQKETDWLLSQKDWLIQEGYKGFLYIGDYVLKINM